MIKKLDADERGRTRIHHVILNETATNKRGPCELRLGTRSEESRGVRCFLQSFSQVLIAFQCYSLYGRDISRPYNGFHGAAAHSLLSTARCVQDNNLCRYKK